MILAGDIGGTKTVLALFSIERGVEGGAISRTRFESGKYDSLEKIIRDFLKQTGAQPKAACFGVAGPVNKQVSQITNLPWSISGKKISATFNIEKVSLINDLESVATAVPFLDQEDVYTLHEGKPDPNGNIAVIAPGTGLGAAFLVWTGDSYKALASEGGHSSFSPCNMQEIELLKFLQKKYGHVSFERICSGSHLPNIYDFFVESNSYQVPDWLKNELDRADDRTPIIVENALAKKADICEATLDMFINILGSSVSNMAITILPRGGIYLGGGIPPRILDRLKRPDFLSAVGNKGRFSDLCSNMPIHVILTAKAALYGAAKNGFELLSE
ncbi:glucokinase [Desulfopila sp. IMCC35008]|uniref:glucokinase n=1 Tax=Desulfopila sp. IMCC35008 TaxID=2653858 RepID=UPI0013D043E4|nr:glucokinase [Desulfopila sp. IMCC35008]